MGLLLGNFGTSLTLLLAHLSLFRAHREHKVHNIVLYPDKESWCKTTPIKQVVTWPSCEPQELDNNVCVGACFSYMVPHSEPSAPGDLIRPYCDSCQPLDSIWHTVTLDCKDKEDNPTTMQKKVQIITNCSCSSCMESSRIKPDFNSLLQSLDLESALVNQQQQQQQQQQQLLQEQALAAALAGGGAASSSVAPEQTATAPEPMGGAGESATTEQSGEQLQSEQQAPAPDSTPELLLNPNLNATAFSSMGLLGKGSGGSATSGSDRFLQMFKKLGEANVAVDEIDKIGKLESLEKLEKLEKLAIEYGGATELLSKLSEILRKYRTQGHNLDSPSLDPLNQEDDDDDDDDTDDLLQLHRSASSTSSTPPPLIPPKDDDDEEVPSLHEQQLIVAEKLAEKMHRTGPHHSMVLDSGVKEKIDVESHYLHPALAGQEISYQDNVLLDKTKKKDF